MRAQARALRAALSSLDDPLIAFAVKANPNIAVLTTLAKEGLGADVVSGGEYLRARAAGVAPERIVFSGVGKTAEEMRTALAGGLCQFNLESFPEAEMLSEIALAMGRTAPVAFRVNPDVDAGLACENLDRRRAQQVRHSDRRGARRLRRVAGARPGWSSGPRGAHRQPAHQPGAARGRDRQAWRDDRRCCVRTGMRSPPPTSAAGSASRYDPAAPPPPSVEDYGAMVARLTHGWDVRLIFEPGRLIVGDAGVLLTEVIRIKPGARNPFVIVDAAMNDLVRPSLYDAWHEIAAVAPKASR